MTSEIMEVVLTRIDRELKFQNRKVVFFLDNAPSHPKALRNKLTQIKLVFLPKCTMSRFQPLDAGIIGIFKYITLLVKYVVSRVDEGKTTCYIIQD